MEELAEKKVGQNNGGVWIIYLFNFLGGGGDGQFKGKSLGRKDAKGQQGVLL